MTVYDEPAPTTGELIEDLQAAMAARQIAEQEEAIRSTELILRLRRNHADSVVVHEGWACWLDAAGAVVFRQVDSGRFQPDSAADGQETNPEVNS